MSDTTNGDDRKGRGAGKGGRGGKPGDGPRRPSAGRPAGGKGGDRGERPKRAASGDGPARPPRDGDRPRGGERPRRAEGERPKSFRPRPDGDAPARGRGDGEAGGKPPFKPRSRGMLSHGGSAGEGRPERPRSYGRLQHDGAKDERKPRPVSDDRKSRASSSDARDAGPKRPPRAAPAVDATGTMRIARRLARAGIASRRDAEGMIADGRVRVNGKVLDTPALDVSGSDVIEVDGTRLPAIERTRLWLFHKPAGTVTTNRDPEGRPTVFDRLPSDMPRVLSIGRLDISTEGLLLLTNDGGLARVLELPSTGWLRRYRVRAHGTISQAKLDELRQGIAIDGVFYGAIEATLDREQGANVWLTLGLREGKNREVKRVLGHLGLDVNRLIRLSFGPFQLGDLKEGAVQEIKGKMLREQLGDRLIEDAGADFEAPVTNVFSNKPVQAEEPGPDLRPKRRGDWVSASETAPNKKKVREAKRDDALGRLDTRSPRGERDDRSARKPAGGRPERSERPGRPERGGRDDGDRRTGGRFDGPKKSFGDRGAGDGDRSPAQKPFGEPKRSANVWIAPGAKPLGARNAQAAQNRAAGERPGSDRPRGERPSRGRPSPTDPSKRAGKPGGRPKPGGATPPRRPRKD
ncbi:pseudouridine synthase [Aurantimonas sp. HBX-1]|uniref:pseudouridine synthase n=1 Tax=Aurantimonas sp. HBX-1 TaxID=2906072 RepID=UPI001F31E2FE|nr:pseudouridine synthase [Aurantimonas sp. HBX-1]UIJ71262.1 pseudouridine synthase [Aurantimonas sp. HBX-1]